MMTFTLDGMGLSFRSGYNKLTLIKTFSFLRSGLCSPTVVGKGGIFTYLFPLSNVFDR